MSKLKKLIHQLSDNELKTIYNSLVESEATKSAELLKLFRENKLTNAEIKAEIKVNNNAFYTLRSRLNEKIESFFLQQMESPRTTLLKQVASINEIIHTKNKTIAVAALKKLEKELIDYDLSNELLIIYKALKRLTIYEPDYYSYSQLYNKHVSFMMSVDKAEDMLANFFKIFGVQILNYNKSENLTLSLTVDELSKINDRYHSHRLKIYYYCAALFHKVSMIETLTKDDHTFFKKTFEEIKHIFENYSLDTTYYNLQWVFQYIQMLYHYKCGSYKLVDSLLEQINKISGKLITNYTCYTTPSYFLLIKLERYSAMGIQHELRRENEHYFSNIEIDKYNLPVYITYHNYRALSSIFVGDYEDGMKHINLLLENSNVRNHQKVIIDLKLLSVYCMVNIKKHTDANFLLNNVQRQIRAFGKEDCEHSYAFMKVLKAILTDLDAEKKNRKIITYEQKLSAQRFPFHSPLKFIKIETEKFLVKNEESL